MWIVLGHSSNKRYFESAIKNGQLAHAYIFSGPDMVGKKMFAYDLAIQLNGRGIENNPDFKSVGPKIEDIRGLKSFLSNKPYFGPYQIVVIDNAEQMTTEASNAVLKTLEEPSLSTILILITSKPRHLLPTISSRCQEIKFNCLTDNEITKFIPAKFEANDKELLKRLSGNRPGWLVKNSNNLSEIKKSVQEFNKVMEQGIFEKIQYASKIYDTEIVPELINNLIYWHYGQNQTKANLLRGLTKLSNTISQPQFNKRLALESFLLGLTIFLKTL